MNFYKKKIKSKQKSVHMKFICVCVLKKEKQLGSHWSSSEFFYMAMHTRVNQKEKLCGIFAPRSVLDFWGLLTKAISRNPCILR